MKKNLVKGVFVSVLCSLFFFGSCADKQVVKGDALCIIATVTMAPEYKKEVLVAVQAVVDATRKEQGCASYCVYEDVNDPLKFVFIETWKSQDAFEFHTKTAHFNDFVKAIEGKTTLEISTLKQKF